jgi:hypothetical protein
MTGICLMLFCRLLVAIGGVQQVQDGLDGVVIADAGVEHGLEELAIRPFVAEVVFHELPAVVVHGVHQFDGLRLVADALEHPAELEFARGIQKNENVSVRLRRKYGAPRPTMMQGFFPPPVR